VHTWYSTDRERTNQKIDRINERMWATLQQGGTVAIHCLAGIHRAAMITACHFLYRHHVLGHTNIPCDEAEIYRKLISVRPHVSPAYQDILRGYKAHVRGAR
jgi:protein tyrosine/serine phosphatase